MWLVPLVLSPLTTLIMAATWELQIDLCPLPADPRVNVVAQVCEPDLALLPYAADPAYQFEFCE